MAAIAIPSTRPWTGRDGRRPPSDRLPGDALSPAGRPLRQGGRTTAVRPTPAVYRRRRLVAAALLLAVLAVMVLGLQAVLGRFGGGPLTTTGAPGASAVAPALRPIGLRVHVVQPGDTLWSIARGLSDGGDPRPIVDRLMAERHGRPLQVGERILLP